MKVSWAQVERAALVGTATTATVVVVVIVGGGAAAGARAMVYHLKSFSMYNKIMVPCGSVHKNSFLLFTKYVCLNLTEKWNWPTLYLNYLEKT